MVLVLPDENSIYGFEKGWKLWAWVKIMKNKKKKLCLLGFVMDFNDDGSCAAAGLRNPLSVLMIFMNS